ncbi:MAG: cyclophilin-like family protein [Hyphomicrobiaceae bacterium]
MPTNLIRQKLDERPAAAATKRAPAPERLAVLTAGQVSVRIRLHQTRTADLIWRALPLHSIVETWGDSIHFDTPLKTGRERSAKVNVAPGDVCFWTEDERVVLAWGPTPISRPSEVRLMRPCNIWAEAIDDPSALAAVTPGEKAVLSRA